MTGIGYSAPACVPPTGRAPLAPRQQTPRPSPPRGSLLPAPSLPRVLEEPQVGRNEVRQFLQHRRVHLGDRFAVV